MEVGNRRCDAHAMCMRWDGDEDCMYVPIIYLFILIATREGIERIGAGGCRVFFLFFPFFFFFTRGG